MAEQRRGKKALVTGASGGIGEHLAAQLAADGVNLVITARRGDALEALAERWRRAHGVTVETIALDLAAPGAAAALADQLHGQDLDYLINNAGFGAYGVFADSDPDTNLRMMRLNMEALTVLTQRCLPGILRRRGRIMNVASTAAFQPGPYMAVYYATKAYVLSFSEALASELEGTGVTVTALCPGPTASGFQAVAALDDSALVKGKRLPTSEEVAKAGLAALWRGQRVYIPGVGNWLLAQSVRFSPRRVVTTLVKWLSRPV